MSYPDVEVALMDYLDDLGYTVTSTPPDLVSHLPVLRIKRVGGQDNKEVGQDQPDVSIHVFALRDSTNPRAAHDLTADVRDRMDEIEGVATTGGLLYHAHMASGPIEQPWPDENIAVVQTVWRVTTRSN